MTTGPVVGPFDKLIIVNATAYTLSSQGESYTNPPTGAGSDDGKTLSFGASTLTTITLPPGLTMGFKCELYTQGTGGYTVKAATGVTVNGVSAGAGSSVGRYAMQRLQSVDQDVYVLTNETTVTTS